MRFADTELERQDSRYSAHAHVDGAYTGIIVPVHAAIYHVAFGVSVYELSASTHCFKLPERTVQRKKV